MRGGRRLSFAVVHAESDFKAEVLAGEVLSLRTAVEAIGVKSITFRHRLLRSEDDAVVFETAFRCVLLDLENRRAVAVPDDIRAKAQAYLMGEGD